MGWMICKSVSFSGTKDDDPALQKGGGQASLKSIRVAACAFQTEVLARCVNIIFWQQPRIALDVKTQRVRSHLQGERGRCRCAKTTGDGLVCRITIFRLDAASWASEQLIVYNRVLLCEPSHFIFKFLCADIRRPEKRLMEANKEDRERGVSIMYFTLPPLKSSSKEIDGASAIVARGLTAWYAECSGTSSER